MSNTTTENLYEARKAAKERGASYATLSYKHNDDGTIEETATLDDGTVLVEDRLSPDTVFFRGAALSAAGFIGDVLEDDTFLWASPEVAAFAEPQAA